MNAEKIAAAIVLASASPRRKVLFAYIGVPFEMIASKVEEIKLPNETPESHVLRLSALKAMHVHGTINNRIVVGVDTVVELDGDPDPEAGKNIMDDLNQFHFIQEGIAANHIHIALVELAVTPFLGLVGPPYRL